MSLEIPLSDERFQVPLSKSSLRRLMPMSFWQMFALQPVSQAPQCLLSWRLALQEADSSDFAGMTVDHATVPNTPLDDVRGVDTVFPTIGPSQNNCSSFTSEPDENCAAAAAVGAATSLQHGIGPDAGPVKEDASDVGPEVVDALLWVQCIALAAMVSPTITRKLGMR